MLITAKYGGALRIFAMLLKIMKLHIGYEFNLYKCYDHNFVFKYILLCS